MKEVKNKTTTKKQFSKVTSLMKRDRKFIIKFLQFIFMNVLRRSYPMIKFISSKVFNIGSTYMNQ